MLLVEGEADFEFLVAVVHEVLEDDRGGDNQRADDKRCDVVEEEIADGADLGLEGYNSISIVEGDNRCIIGQADITLTAENINDYDF